MNNPVIVPQPQGVSLFAVVLVSLFTAVITRSLAADTKITMRDADGEITGTLEVG